ncbi:hypothetical protein CDAR_294941 [Caerostris darwini]|uniref:Uncharacterized protein n=1 Tax=Caerostris darwini TaxID=1538125 RepID=A0AAV4UKW2_9ARAC|nr:hypothetical protein CDAR_294941 [Caerostris darwini]
MYFMGSFLSKKRAPLWCRFMALNETFNPEITWVFQKAFEEEDCLPKCTLRGFGISGKRCPPKIELPFYFGGPSSGGYISGDSGNTAHASNVTPEGCDPQGGNFGRLNSENCYCFEKLLSFNTS